MAIRQIVRIDEDKCDGCGRCVPACAEGAIQIIDGKARLVSEVLCDGLGACLGDCPRGAISLEEREADAYDEEAVRVHGPTPGRPIAGPDELPILNGGGCAASAAGGGCPGSVVRTIGRTAAEGTTSVPSQLAHWPVQLALVPPHAPFLAEADLVVCADCVPFAVPDFHARYLAGRAVVVGCPKLDDLEQHFDKLKALFARARPRQITVLRMEVPCCSGLAQATLRARDEVASDVPLAIHTVHVEGHIDVEVPSRGASEPVRAE